MKKLYLLILIFLGFSLMGCKESEKPTLLVPAGSPLITIGGMLDKVDYEAVTGPSLLPSEFIKGEKDIIVAPVIIGAKLYIAGSSKYQLAAVVGLSNLYILSRTKLSSIADLEGKKILAFGEHATPGIVLKSLLKDQQTDVEWGTDIKEMIGPFTTKKTDYVLISEPALTTVKSKLTETIYTLSLKDLFEGDIIQVGVFIHPNSDKKLDKILTSIKSNIAYLKENPEKYAKSIIHIHPQLTEFGEQTITNAIPNLDLDYLEASTHKAKIEAFFNVLNQSNKELLLNQLPDDTFYYEGQ